jgi:hypothetical protein
MRGHYQGHYPFATPNFLFYLREHFPHLVAPLLSPTTNPAITYHVPTNALQNETSGPAIPGEVGLSWSESRHTG